MHSFRLPSALASVGIAIAIGLIGHAQLQQQPAARQAQNTAGGIPFPESQLRRTPYPKINVAVSYKLVEGWPRKPPDVVMGMVSSVAVDQSGNVWTFDRGTIPVQTYKPDGTFVRMWGQGLFKNPHQIRFDRSGNVWIADDGDHTVTKFTPDGQVLMTIGVKGVPGNDQQHLNRPTDVAVTPAGDVFISDGYGNDRIVHYDKTGKFVKSWGKIGSGPGEFSVPHNIVVDSKGRLYVADRNNVRVQVFEQSGKYLTEWRNIITPWGLWISREDEIYVVGSGPATWWEAPGSAYNGLSAKAQMVVRFDTDGRVQQLWSFPRGTAGQAAKPGEVNTVHGLAVGPSGDLYLAEAGSRRAEKFARIESDVPLPSRSGSR